MNFSFLSPLFLIGLAAVALPIIAHLISRKSGFKKRFPAVRFLLASQGEMAASSRLKDLILLLLRSLLIVLVVLLFAKPAVFSFSSADSSDPVSVAVVLDNSFSMGYGDNFKKAKKEGEQIIDSAPDGSFFASLPLVPAENESISVVPDKDQAKKSLKEVTLSSTFTDNERRLERVYSALEKAPNEIKQVILITDLQKNGWKSGDYKRKWLTLINISDEQTPENRAVTDIKSRYSKDSVKVKVRVSNFSDEAAEDLLTETGLSGEEMRAYLDVGPRDVTSGEFIFPVAEAGQAREASGAAQIPRDDLRADDARHFVLSRSGLLSVLIVDGDPREDSRLSESYYLAGAAETASELMRSSIKVTDNDSFLDEELSGYDIIFLANVGEITPKKARDIEEYIRSGGTAVIFPGERVRAKAYNTLLKNVLPGELGPPAQGEFLLVPGGNVMFSEELFEKINQAKVKKAFILIPAKGTEVLIQLSDGAPFLSASKHGGGNVFLFTSTADTSWSNFAITPIFAPVIKEFLDFKSLSNTQKRNYTVGDEVTIDTVPQPSSIEVTDPLGEKFNIETNNPVFRATLASGIYTVDIDGREAYEFSVNLDPRESNLEKLTAARAEPVPHKEVGLIKVFREFWRYFLWGVIVLFISESIARVLFS